jgi:hypothetical protein
VQVGRNYRVRASAIERYLDAHVVDPSAIDLAGLEGSGER